MTDVEFMRLALAEAERGVSLGQMPFGAAVAKKGALVASAHNATALTIDPTAHAEVDALRAAARALGSTDLSGCTLYATCEPCPMCLAAAHWAGVDRVVFGATIGDAVAAGIGQLTVGAAELAAIGGSPILVEGEVERADCAALLARWGGGG